MARARLIAKNLGSSRKYHDLLRVGGKLGEFCQVLFPLIIANTDDYGRMAGDAFTIKNVVLPSSGRLEGDFDKALDAMQAVGLIQRYRSGDSDSDIYLQVNKFDEHQPNLHKRTASKCPAPDGDAAAFSALEAQVERHIANELTEGRLTVDGYTIARVSRQVRKASSYIDILAETNEGPAIVIEVKRQRVTAFAISQVLDYCRLVDGPTVPVVIGHGLADNIELPLSTVLIGVYDDSMAISTANSLDVKSRSVTLNHIPAQSNVTESNVTEPNRTQNMALAPVGARRTADALFEEFWKAYPKKKAKDDARKAWDKRRPDGELSQTIQAAIASQRQSPDWLKDGGRYIPFPATWLNRGQWTDSADPLSDGPVLGRQSSTLLAAVARLEDTR